MLLEDDSAGSQSTDTHGITVSIKNLSLTMTNKRLLYLK